MSEKGRPRGGNKQKKKAKGITHLDVARHAWHGDRLPKLGSPLGVKLVPLAFDSNLLRAERHAAAYTHLP